MLSHVFKRLKTLFAQQTLDAAHAWHQSGGDALHAYWMFAAPVHLTLGRDNFFMTEPAPLPLAADETDALISSLNEHFREDGLHFYIKEGNWYIGLDQDPKVKLTPLKQVISQDVAGAMPTGEGALGWIKLQNEMQMLLYLHPVNQAREAAGKLVVNSICCYGLGQAVINA